MGTRGAYGIRYKGEDKVTYNHWDSYPRVLGQTMIDFCNNHSIRELKELFKKIRLVEDAETPTTEDRQRFKEYITEDIGYREDFYSLLRGLMGQPEQLFNAPIMNEASEFLLDSLFCEYAYIINLDENTLEVYRGFVTKTWGKKGRYVKATDGYEATSNTYYGVELAYVFALPEVMDEPEHEDRITTAEVTGEQLQVCERLLENNFGID